MQGSGDWKAVAGWLVVSVALLVGFHFLIAMHLDHNDVIKGLEIVAVIILFGSYLFSEVFKVRDAASGSGKFEFGFREVFLVLFSLAVSVTIYVISSRYL